MAAYVAVIHKEEQSEYGVSFPDFPGCITGGIDLDEAAESAREALAAHIEAMRELGETIPEPSTLEQARADELAENAAAFLLVEAPDAVAKSVRVNITLPEDDLARIDDYARRHGYTRSGLLTHGAKRLMRSAA